MWGHTYYPVSQIWAINGLIEAKRNEACLGSRFEVYPVDNRGIFGRFAADLLVFRSSTELMGKGNKSFVSPMFP